MTEPRTYAGIDNDEFGGMTPVGTIIRDAWVFDILPREETCEGWSPARLQALYEQVWTAWEPYGHLASRLPPELAEHHRLIHDEAIARAKALGWQATLGEDD
jgi:hypothetical protein